MADIRQQLRAAFDGEVREHLSAIRAELARADAGAAADLRDVFRRAHSLKGAARAVDLPAVETIAHALEEMLATAEAGAAPLDAPAVRAMLDRLEDAVGVRADPPGEGGGEQARSQGLLRVSGDHVERLAQGVASLAATLQGQAGADRELVMLRDMLRTMRVQHEQGRPIGSMLAEAGTTAARLAQGQREQGEVVGRALAALERDAAAVMLEPAERLVDGFERMVRELAESQGKAAELRIEGAAIEADRRMLQALRDAVLHAVRNAVSHGIEPPAARRATGKDATGRVTLTLSAVAGLLRIEVADDGAGLDEVTIAARARAAGLLPAGGSPPTGAALHALLFEQGFSTSARVDRVAGRGVGLSVVAEAARRLGGSVAIGNAPGGGARLTIAVPLTLSREPVLLFRCGGVAWGLPARAVARVLRLEPDAVTDAGDGRVLTADGVPVPLVPAARLLDVEEAATTGAVILLDGGGGRAALLVEALDGVRALVAGDPGAIAPPTALVTGTLLLEDGALALLLSPDLLIERIMADRRRLSAAPVAAAVAAGKEDATTILVVDDSITTRTLEKAILEAAGYRVLLGVDGIDALERLRGTGEPIALVIADVEMPRMDGFGLLSAMRNDPSLANIPVVMMTSRNSPDDIRRGLDLGANAYTTKQDFEQGALLAIIGQLI